MKNDAESIQTNVTNDNNIVVAVVIIVTISFVYRQPDLKAGTLCSFAI